MEKGSRKDKNQNIQVFVRLRPLNQRERDIKSLGVVEVVNNREVVVRQSSQTSLTKKFTFDRAFGPGAKQVEIYQDVVSPLIEEVLAGYNCTVFAYGQTGTGKTHTMVGEHTNNETTWQNDPLAGIIPRALSQLFDELRLTNTEYTVRVSYLELYNEELFDLLSTSEDNSKLRIYEDVTRKGANIVNGLEEITVYNKNEVYKIMSQGQERKRVASTLMNAQSSRSHTVFTIVVHMKENSPEGEELVKIGKLNLVDLAGSENISKAGSDNPAKRERARECVNINQSLLTLGRVITALVERHPHIPYRESKLTRILQESLGGRTKTSIIATISPGHKDLEETMSTLEYAHRAKNIQNKPEINQKMTKKAILKEYAEEIDRLKRDLQASRDKNGVYLATETYTEMTLKQEEQRKEIQELLLQKRAMEEARDKMQQVFTDLNMQLEMKEKELDKTIKKLDSTKEKLVNTSNMLSTTKLHFEEQRHLVSKQRETEKKLSEQAQQLLNTAEVATSHVANLHDTVDRRKKIESANLEATRTFREQSAQKRSTIDNYVVQFTQQLDNVAETLKQFGEYHTVETIQKQDVTKSKIEALVQKIVEAMNEMKSLTSQTHETLTSQTLSKQNTLLTRIKEHSTRLHEMLKCFVKNVENGVKMAQNVEEEGVKNIQGFVENWYSSSSSRVTSLRSSEKKFTTSLFECEGRRYENVVKQKEARKVFCDRRDQAMAECLREISEERFLIEQRLTKQLEDIAMERQETEQSLTQWMEEEREAFEARLQKHVTEQKNILEKRLERKMAEIEEERRLLEERLEKRMRWQEEEIKKLREEFNFEEEAIEQYSSGADECKKLVRKYSKVFDDGTSAISIDMEAFSKNVLEIVEHITAGMMKSLHTAKDTVNSDANKLSQIDEECAQQFADETSCVFTDVVNSTKHTMDTFLQNVEANNSQTIKDLNTITTDAESQITIEKNHLDSTQNSTNQIHRASEMFRDSMKREIENHGEMEHKYLMQEYTVYSPTGRTPSRQQFGYPRDLVATSPHERILARFRAMRQNSEEDCVILDSEPDTRPTSDAESSVSEDSAVFAAPSPPDRNNHIVKSTSETDIYAIRRQQQNGKENTERMSSSTKKPSRLPAPASLKKPLAVRNTDS